jgi:hypothetical protein
MKSSIFWDIVQFSPVKFNPRFGGTFRLHFQGRRRHTKNQREAGGKRSGFLLGLFFDPDDGGDVSETLVDFQRTTRRYISQDRTIQSDIYLHIGLLDCQYSKLKL